MYPEWESGLDPNVRAMEESSEVNNRIWVTQRPGCAVMYGSFEGIHVGQFCELLWQCVEFEGCEWVAIRGFGRSASHTEEHAGKFYFKLMKRNSHLYVHKNKLSCISVQLGAMKIHPEKLLLLTFHFFVCLECWASAHTPICPCAFPPPGTGLIVTAVRFHPNTSTHLSPVDSWPALTWHAFRPPAQQTASLYI
jgi:hypothetical protein